MKLTKYCLKKGSGKGVKGIKGDEFAQRTLHLSVALSQ
jgi:hypothetical protein